MSANLEIKTDFVALSKKYAGRWVAIDPETNEVVASGETAQEVVKISKESGVKDPIITGVSEDYGSYAPCLTA